MANETDLDEVKVTAKPWVKTTIAPAEDAMPEIVVTARKIPWWMWAIAGGAAAFLLAELTRPARRRR